MINNDLEPKPLREREREIKNNGEGLHDRCEIGYAYVYKVTSISNVETVVATYSGN